MRISDWSSDVCSSDLQLVGAPFYDFDDHAVGLAAVFARRLDQHAVAMQDLEHLARRQEQVGATVIAQQKAEAVAVPLHLASHEIELGGQQQHALAVRQDRKSVV